MTSSRIEYFTGDTVDLAVRYTTSSGEVYAIDLGATVTCCLRRELGSGRASISAGPWTCSSGATGADWTDGLVIATIDGTDTVSLTPGQYYLEVTIDDGGVDLTRVPKQILNVRQRVNP